eukprot:6491869-Amphidinium_carterae.2
MVGQVFRAWLIEYLKPLGLTFWKHLLRSSVTFAHEQVLDLQGNVHEKIRWLQFFHKVADTQVFNHDETSCRLLPFNDKGWKDAKTDAKAVADSRLHCTVGNTVPMVFGEKWYSHIIFPGNSTRSLPKTKWGDDILCDCTQNVDSLLRFVNFLDTKIQSSADDKENLLFVVDCAPMHTAQELRARLPQHVRLCYINPEPPKWLYLRLLA